MLAIAKFSRSLLLGALVAGAVVLGFSGRASAACVNDIDCPGGGATCGGEVCDYSTVPPACKPAGTAAKGEDGWCTKDTDCKCYAQTARCNTVYCTFTKASDAPAGAAGTSGTAGHTGGAGATGSGGSTGTAGSPGTAGSTGSAGTGGTGTTSSGGGGCAVAPRSGGLAASLLGLALVVTRLARRRRA
jgi:hypothetical protein